MGKKMSKGKTASSGGGDVASFLQGLFQLGVYKASQGRVTRQSTFAVLAITFFLGSWRLFATQLKPAVNLNMAYLISGALLAAGLWLSYRVVNYPKFADFLIAVEAEMNKVSWPTRGELIRSSLVVLFVILFLAAILFGFDLFWQWFFEAIGVLRRAATPEAP